MIVLVFLTVLLAGLGALAWIADLQDRHEWRVLDEHARQRAAQRRAVEKSRREWDSGA